jgi:signal transduction histidine kinase/ActR/RegA family two-component response regulator
MYIFPRNSIRFILNRTNEMHMADQKPIHIRSVFIDENNIKGLFRVSVILRYAIGLIAMAFLFLFRKQLPFPFPAFFFVAFALIAANGILHLFSLRKRWLKPAFTLLPYFDVCFAPLVFTMSGGFLSPFIITHLITTVGSGILYTSNKHLALHSFIILLTSYIGVAFLQKFGVVPCYVDYVKPMLDNDFFFYLVITITSSIFTIGFLMVKVLNAHVHKMLDDMTRTFDSILKGTAAVVGQDFFVHLSKSLSAALPARCVLIAELTKKNQSLHTLALWKDGVIEQNDEFTIEKTIFSQVIKHGSFLSTDSISVFFDNTPLLVQCGATFFLGILLADTKGRPIGILCIITDTPMENMQLVEPLITIFASRASAELERKHAEEKRKHTELQLAHAHKMEALGQLVGGIAHDFNNMLSAITGYATLLSNKLDQTSPGHRYAQQILRAGNRTAELIANLTQFVRRGMPQQKPMDVHKVIEETLALLDRTLNKNITLIKEFAAPLTLSRGDATLLQNVFMNLAINARDAMADGNGTLTFATSVVQIPSQNILCQTFQIAPGDYIAVSISDTGCGMSEDVMNHLFEPFYTTKEKGKGTGLGLANVWGYIENYKCAIEVKSNVGEGATFIVYLPLIKGTDVQTKKSSGTGAEAAVSAGSRHVLVVDDEESMREILSEILAGNGFSVTACAGGKEAVSYIEKKPGAVNLVILDIMMPEMNGHDTFYAIRKIVPSMKIILASGFIDAKGLKGILKETGTSFIQKPFTEAQIIREIALLSGAA